MLRVLTAAVLTFQPMNINFGLFPPIDDSALVMPEGVKRWKKKDKRAAKKRALCQKALTDFEQWLKNN